MHQVITSIDSIAEGAKIYFLGIGGVSMGGLAEIAHHLGYQVQGSDQASSHRTIRLRSLGVVIHEQHHPRWIEDFQPDILVYTSAIPEDNSELLAARALGIPTVERAVFLGWLTRRYDHVVNVAGTHGKTTTTAMIAEILLVADVDPTVHLGAEFDAFGDSTVRIGSGNTRLISEACEYKKNLLRFHSTTAILLNIDADHLDVYSGIDEIIDTFVQFALELPEEGILIQPFEGPYIDRFNCGFESQRVDAVRRITFGTAKAPSVELWQKGLIPDYAASDIRYERGLPRFTLFVEGEAVIEFSLNIPGEHNILNALAAIAASHQEGASFKSCVEGLEVFHGAEGRFSYIGEFQGAPVYTDYAHHPTAVQASLKAATEIPHDKIVAVFQPLTYARVKFHFREFLDALEQADGVIFYEIFSDRERDTLGMSSRLLEEEYRKTHEISHFAPDFDTMVDLLKDLVEPEDILLFLGPEQVRSFAPRLIEATKE